MIHPSRWMNHENVIAVDNWSVCIHECAIWKTSRAIRVMRERPNLHIVNRECEICKCCVCAGVIQYTVYIDCRACVQGLNVTFRDETSCSPWNAIVTLNSFSGSLLWIVASCYAFKIKCSKFYQMVKAYSLLLSVWSWFNSTWQK
jgi:hypothetical protein